MGENGRRIFQISSASVEGQLRYVSFLHLLSYLPFFSRCMLRCMSRCISGCMSRCMSCCTSVYLSVSCYWLVTCFFSGFCCLCIYHRLSFSLLSFIPSFLLSRSYSCSSFPSSVLPLLKVKTFPNIFSIY